MRYRRATVGEVLVHKGDAADSLYIISSGSVHTFASVPQHFQGERPDAAAFSLLVPIATLRVGEVIGKQSNQRFIGGCHSQHSSFLAGR
jgi:CRP-like cAMP-binding protein